MPLPLDYAGPASTEARRATDAAHLLGRRRVLARIRVRLLLGLAAFALIGLLWQPHEAAPADLTYLIVSGLLVYALLVGAARTRPGWRLGFSVAGTLSIAVGLLLLGYHLAARHPLTTERLPAAIFLGGTLLYALGRQPEPASTSAS